MAEERTTQNAAVFDAVNGLVEYGVLTGLIEQADIYYAANGILDALRLDPPGDYSPLPAEADEYGSEDFSDGEKLESILKVLLDDAAERGVIDGGIASRDLLDTKLMGVLTPRPSDVISSFEALESIAPELATDYFYDLAESSDYIRRYRIKKDRKWIAPTPYGDLDITINLSKPEKDPKAIAAALNKKQDAYPKCLLCVQNEGYAGRLDHPARENLRLIPMMLDGSQFFMQYSPYVYYNEHCIVLSGNHEPMKIDRHTFARLLDFTTRLPHYMLGSNADLPIVGGSILTHEHYQGGQYTFAMAKAPVRKEVTFTGFEDVTAGIVHWPMSVLRLQSPDPARIVDLADKILQVFRGYSDPSADVLAFTDKDGNQVTGVTYGSLPEGVTPHNTITPICRRQGSLYELDLVLRNNRTTAEHPLGIFHPHAELHHIKKENIGLIEVMGLAVLPARLLGEMEQLKDTILAGQDVAGVAEIAAHADWAAQILEKYPAFAPAAVAGTIEEKGAEAAREELGGIVEKEIGLVFSTVLEHCGIFKDTPEGAASFDAFLDAVNKA